MNGTSEIQLLLDTLAGQHGWLSAVGCWIAALRISLKPFAVQLSSFLERAALRIAETTDTEDDSVLDRVLASRWYRVLAFLVDLLASVKLPLSTVPTPASAAQKSSP